MNKATQPTRQQHPERPERRPENIEWLHRFLESLKKTRWGAL